MGAWYLNFSNKALSYCSEAVLPFYILHQTIILLIGSFIVQWGLGIMLKYLIISTSSLVVIMAIYELFIKRLNALRFLFGMKTGKRLGKEPTLKTV